MSIATQRQLLSGEGVRSPNGLEKKNPMAPPATTKDVPKVTALDPAREGRTRDKPRSDLTWTSGSLKGRQSRKRPGSLHLVSFKASRLNFQVAISDPNGHRKHHLHSLTQKGNPLHAS
jgi:hypothetical protein